MNVRVPGSGLTDNNIRCLRQLSDDVTRIAAMLASLSSGMLQVSEGASEKGYQNPADLLGLVTNAIKARRMRDRFFSSELFADPAWDILLELLKAELSQYRVSVTSLSIAADVPTTTALRWIAAMTDQGLLRRRPDPHDARRMFIELTPKSSNAMRDYFACLANQ